MLICCSSNTATKFQVENDTEKCVEIIKCDASIDKKLPLVIEQQSMELFSASKLVESATFVINFDSEIYSIETDYIQEYSKINIVLYTDNDLLKAKIILKNKTVELEVNRL